jgi:hypothetical protein
MVPLALCLVLVGACSQSDDVPAPHIASVNPAHGVAGSTVTVSGSDFCQQPVTTDDPLACANVGVVSFGVAPTNTVEYADDSISVEVPNGTGTVQVVVSSNGRSSNGVDFTFD